MRHACSETTRAPTEPEWILDLGGFRAGLGHDRPEALLRSNTQGL